jgi:hypothetical protein
MTQPGSLDLGKVSPAARRSAQSRLLDLNRCTQGNEHCSPVSVGELLTARAASVWNLVCSLCDSPFNTLSRFSPPGQPEACSIHCRR